ncbi:MAG: hypothetical protein DHS20C12_04400 [Pseudohongiella sp.]|nr:MAG: hypothetical protein DHS20C12_04400 [Pseudohongiella sp.]
MNRVTKHTEVEIPETMRDLDVTSLGYLKPWFVKADDFRVVDVDKAWMSIGKKACWICGKPFKPNEFAMVGDANCAALRVYTEPPCHADCAVYAAQVCPFMLYPNAKRRTAGLEEDETLAHRNESADVLIKEENPGEYFIVVVNDFDFSNEHHVMTFPQENILEIQYWIGGTRQAEVPDPIVPVA